VEPLSGAPQKRDVAQPQAGAASRAHEFSVTAAH
jgi:hypothetical protein